MYIDAAFKEKESIVVWVRKPDHTLDTEEHDIPCYFFKKTNIPTKYHTMDGGYAEKVSFNSVEEYYNAVAFAEEELYESDISFIEKFLSDNYHNKINKHLHVGYFDIEVEYDLSEGNGYPMPDNPTNEINAISLFDGYKEKFYQIVLVRDGRTITLDDGDGYPVEVIECVTERQLMDNFIRLIEDIDILTAWNGDKYDIPYIIGRCVKLYKEKGLSALCRNGFNAKKNIGVDDYGNEVTTYRLFGRVHLDMMEVYKKSTFGERPSYSLDNICEFEGVGKKIPYKGDLGDLYRSDPQLFFEYSLHDSKLLMRLDKKMKIMELNILRAQGSTVRYNDIFGSIKPLEMKIRNYTHHQRDEILVLPDKDKSAIREDFEGGFVINTKVGVYKISTSIDLGSLYPSVIRSLNVSPETHILQLKNNAEDFPKVVMGSNEGVIVIHMKTGKEMPVTGKELKDIITTKNLTISAYGSMFTKKRGIIPEILDLWIAERKIAKEKMLHLQDDLLHCEDEDKKLQLKNDISFWNMKQLLVKLNNNSLYGAVSNRYCRFYTIYCAASTTLTGQAIEKQQIYEGDSILKRLSGAI